MGKSILKLLNFDFNMTKFGCSLQVISLPFTSSSSLSIYLQINLHYVSTYSTTSIYGVLYSHSVSIHTPQYLYICYLYLPVNSVHISSVFICLQIFLIVYMQYLMYLFFYSVQCSFIYSTAPIYLQC